jgi:DUF4097 and DUF4098 domain-containing protein YvlB
MFITCAVMAYGNGLTEAELVNTQQLDMKDVSSVKITYTSDSVKLFKGDSDSLVIKEYMSIDDSDYYARTSYATAANAERQLVIESGQRPVVVSGNFQSYVEVYIPASFTGAGVMAVNTTSGSIRSDGALSFSAISLESNSGSITVNDIGSDTMALVRTTSGNIRVQRIAADKIQVSTNSGSIYCGTALGNIAVITTSGSVDFERMNGNVVAKSTSGSINFRMLRGALRANTTSGSIRCTVVESTGDITLGATSGSVTLSLPRNMGFHFSARVMSGTLSTPFSDQLYSPFSDRHSATGTIGAAGIAEAELISVDITTTSGSIRVEWV